MGRFKYISFCWSIGTTSFRTAEFNLKIERQLDLLSRFKLENKTESWRELQEKYYNFLKQENFLSGDANNKAKDKAKDAREKTSGLVDIGLIDEERNLTEVGKYLLKITKEKMYEPDNIFEIAEDSFIYLKQMLKTYNEVDSNIIRPFIVFLYLVSHLGKLSNDEFTYLLPLCINEKRTTFILDEIKKYRKKLVSIDDIILKIIMNNYKEAHKYLLEKENINEEIICDIGINRKSKQYDKIYYEIFTLLENIIFDKNKSDIIKLMKTVNRIGGKTRRYWIKYLFVETSEKKIKELGFKVLSNNDLFNSKNIKEFKSSFFKTLHLFKAKATLYDYHDLNKRYFKVTDIVLFNDNEVILDTIAKSYFNIVVDKLLSSAYIKSELLYQNVDISKIENFFDVDKVFLYKELSNNLGYTISKKEDVKDIIKKERYKRFNLLLDTRFNIKNIIHLLDKFEIRADSDIRKLVTDNADIPTIFEYIIGICWYIISDRNGNILDYMKLSLEADLLPRSHASGGQADIVYEYEKQKAYPKHAALIEATLSKDKGQRIIEMEPISRHLGDYILIDDDNKYAYTIFISTTLHENLISDFKNRKTYTYRSASKHTTGLKIIPISTSLLKSILNKDITYKELYPLFDAAYHSDTDVFNWYKNDIEEKILNI